LLQLNEQVHTLPMKNRTASGFSGGGAAYGGKL
jgi:hypothetical protein